MTESLTPPTAPWAWPFFDEVHRDVAARLVEWMKRQQVDETDDRLDDELELNDDLDEE